MLLFLFIEMLAEFTVVQTPESTWLNPRFELKAPQYVPESVSNPTDYSNEEYTEAISKINQALVEACLFFRKYRIIIICVSALNLCYIPFIIIFPSYSFSLITALVISLIISLFFFASEGIAVSRGISATLNHVLTLIESAETQVTWSYIRDYRFEAYFFDVKPYQGHSITLSIKK
jgi:hypothetical protein